MSPVELPATTAATAFFATTPKGMEALLASELGAEPIGATAIAPTLAGVAFQGTLEAAYRACLHSRTASRVLMPLASFAATDGEQLYEGVRSVDWSVHLAPGATFAVDCSSDAPNIHSHFGTLRTKDAVVDQLRDKRGARPSVDRATPDLRLNLHLRGGHATVSIDLSGDSLHERHYRKPGAPAPLKENLAAALLLLADWPARAAAGQPLVDPMCGSGTILVEAALMRAQRAPGLLRETWGFAGWAGHDAAVWRRVRRAAVATADEAAARLAGAEPTIWGFDVDDRAVRAAGEHAERAGVAPLVRVGVRGLAEFTAPTAAKGVLVTNPPYGERLGDEADLGPLYTLLGDTLKRRLPGWTGFVLTGSPALAKQIGLKPRRRHVLFNGAIECRLLELPVGEAPTSDEGPAWRRPRVHVLTAGADMFANRLRKNWQHRRKWAAREGITCYRLYDADLPEYAVAVDLYETFLHVQEYAPPATVDADRAEARLADVMAVLPDVLSIAKERVFLKVRRRQRDRAQYEKQGDSGEMHEVREGGCRFLVNFTDHLDTGLFLDHRRVRAVIAGLAPNRDVLNLFAYTGTASVAAALGGARSTTSVDLSHTYLGWAERNFALNRLPPPVNRLVRADCTRYLVDAQRERRRFGVIFVAPPTFSRSKAMAEDFDVQRDHVALLGAAAQLLDDDGVMIFSTHFRRFKMDAAGLPDLEITEITRQTLPLDFERDPRFHTSWRLQRRRG